MKQFFKHIKQQIILIICCFSFLGHAQQLSNQAQISVLTCGTANELYTLYGHTALRVVDTENQIDVVFNYGMFDFGTPNFYAKFVKGDMIYFLDTERYQNFVDGYRYENRSVYEQFLNLSIEQKQKIWDEARRHLRTQERYYQYKFIDNNCTTKVADLINNVLPAPLETKFPDNERTYRNILNDYLKGHYFEALGINMIFGSKVDHINNQLFLPDKLMQGIALSKNGDQMLTSQTIALYEARHVEKSFSWNSIYTFAVVCIALMALSFFNGFRKFYFSLMGLFGVFFIVMAFYSFHKELYWNNVVMLCNPLFLIYIWMRNGAKGKLYFWYAIAAIFIVYLGIVGLDRLKIFAPLLLLNSVVLFLEYKAIKNKRLNTL